MRRFIWKLKKNNIQNKASYKSVKLPSLKQFAAATAMQHIYNEEKSWVCVGYVFASYALDVSPRTKSFRKNLFIYASMVANPYVHIKSSRQ